MNDNRIAKQLPADWLKGSRRGALLGACHSAITNRAEPNCTQRAVVASWLTQGRSERHCGKPHIPK